MNSYKKATGGASLSVMKQTVMKPFCKVCHDAGKPENVYTSHFVKDKQGPEGKVVCPYLLSLTCTYCKKQEGHTARHCPNLLAKQHQSQDKHQSQDLQIATQVNDDGWSRVGKKELVTEKVTAVTVSEKVAAPKKVSLMTAFIEEDEKKEEEKEERKVLAERKRIQFESEFPSLPKKQKLHHLQSLLETPSPPPIRKSEVVHKPEVVRKPEVTKALEVEEEVVAKASYEYKFSGSWGDYDD